MYLSHFILERVDVSGVFERWVERHRLRARASSSHIFFQEQGGCQRLHPLASSPETPLIGCVSHARLRFSALCLNLNAWFSSRDLLPVTYLLYPSAPIALLFTNHNVTACQSTRSHKERTENQCHMLYNIIIVSLFSFKYFWCPSFAAFVRFFMSSCTFFLHILPQRMYLSFDVFIKIFMLMFFFKSSFNFLTLFFFFL